MGHFSRHPSQDLIILKKNKNTLSELLHQTKSFLLFLKLQSILQVIAVSPSVCFATSRLPRIVKSLLCLIAQFNKVIRRILWCLNYVSYMPNVWAMQSIVMIPPLLRLMVSFLLIVLFKSNLLHKVNKL